MRINFVPSKLCLVLTSSRFLLVALQIDSLKHCTTIKKLRNAVESLPSGLQDLYERTWERIEAQTEDEVLLATKAIIWLTYAYQPLKVTELQHAVVLDEVEEFDEDDIAAEELIVSVCCGLITFDQQSGIVRLVRECILCSAKTADGQIDDYQITRHTIFSENILLAYLQNRTHL